LPRLFVTDHRKIAQRYWMSTTKAALPLSWESTKATRLANLTPHALTLVSALDSNVTLATLPSVGEARATIERQTSLGSLLLVGTGAQRVVLTSPQRFTGVVVSSFDRASYDAVVVSMATAQTLERTGPPSVDASGAPIARRLPVLVPGTLVRAPSGAIRGAASLEVYENVVL